MKLKAMIRNVLFCVPGFKWFYRALRQYDALLHERSMLIEEREVLRRERDALVLELNAATQERDAVVDELSQWRTEIARIRRLRGPDTSTED
jgi:hypothetical protein